MGSGGSHSLWSPSYEAGAWHKIDNPWIFNCLIKASTLFDPRQHQHRIGAAIDGGILEA
jgi:hypothetical protein